MSQMPRAILAVALVAPLSFAQQESSPAVFPIAYISSSFYPSGDAASWGQDSRRAVTMALDDAKREGWCGPGCEVELSPSLIYEANGTVSQELTAFIGRAVERNVVAILGADWSRVAEATLSALKDLKVTLPLVSGGATGSEFDSAVAHPCFLRSVYSDADGIAALLQDLAERARATRGQGATAPEYIAVLYSEEPLGTAGLQTASSLATRGGPRVLASAGFRSGSAPREVRSRARELLAALAAPNPAALLGGRRPVVFIAATGPDTTLALEALATQGVHGPPGDSWVVGALEAAPSVVHTPQQAAAAMGFNSYLSTTPAEGACAAYDSFVARFRGRHGHTPSGGFAAPSYDSVVLAVAALRAARAAAAPGAMRPGGEAVLAATRLPSFGVQGLTGPLVLAKGQNQPCRSALAVNQLLPGHGPNGTFRVADVASTVSAARGLCPESPVGLSIDPASVACPEPGAWPPELRLLCAPGVQNQNACGTATPTLRASEEQPIFA